MFVARFSRLAHFVRRQKMKYAKEGMNKNASYNGCELLLRSTPTNVQGGMQISPSQQVEQNKN